MRNLLLLLALLFPQLLQAQSELQAEDTLRPEEPNYLMDKYHDILRYHDPIMYLAFPYIQSATGRAVPLEEGEGKNGYLGEGQLAYRFVIHQGKYYSYPLFQRMRFTFDAGMTARLANDFSSPLLPLNARFGLGLDYLLSSLEALKRERATMAWLTLQVHHYSNGQSDSFFKESPVQRNNYKSGDFSTNYARGLLNVALNTTHGHLLTTSLGYQHELDLGGPLILNKELAGYYGLQRLLFGVQWTQKPQLFTVSYKNKGTTGDEDRVTLQKRRQILVRTEMEYILDDLSKWTGSSPQRFGAHAWITYMPSVANEIGLFVHGYYGRDYLNIRFDDVVYIAQLGLCAKFNRR